MIEKTELENIEDMNYDSDIIEGIEELDHNSDELEYSNNSENNENKLESTNNDEINTDKTEENINSDKASLNQEELNELNDISTTNCLALTIKEDYKLVAVKNVFLRSLKVSWKVIVSAVTLNFLKFLFH